MKCENCIYFVKDEQETFEVYDDDKFIGTCRINPPQFEGFPKVFSNDWCGQYILKRNYFNNIIQAHKSTQEE